VIELDEDDIKVSCLNIPGNQLPDGLVKILIEDGEGWCAYVDNILGMTEHMFCLDTVLENIDTEEYTKEIEEIAKLMEEHDCAYFRII
jgi:hypothetical protein